jgi:hypothetical protein
MEWNRQLKSRQITPLEYKNRINNLMDSWSTFANTAKGYDKQMQEALKRQQEGLGSGLELELNNRLAQLGDLRNKATQVDPNNGNFTLKLNTGAMINDVAQIKVVDLSGRVVYQTNAKTINGNLSTNLQSNLSNGVYMVVCTINGKTQTLRMVVQK